MKYRERIRLHTGTVVKGTALAIRESKKMTELGVDLRGRLRLLVVADDGMQKLVDVLHEQIERVQNEQTRIITTKISLQKLAPEGAINNGEEDTNG